MTVVNKFIKYLQTDECGIGRVAVVSPVVVTGNIICIGFVPEIIAIIPQVVGVLSSTIHLMQKNSSSWLLLIPGKEKS